MKQKSSKILLFILVLLCSISYIYSVNNCIGTGEFIKSPNNPIVGLGDSLEWDSETVGREAYYFNGTHHFIYYGGGADIVHRQEESIGVSIGTSLNDMTKYINNPVIDRQDIGYGDADSGIYPSSVFKINDMYYMAIDLVTHPSGYNFNMGIMNSSDLIHWSNLTVLSGGVNDVWNDRARIQINPNNENQLLMLWMRSVSGTYQIYRATANISDIYEWTITDSPLLSQAPGVLYPDLVYNSDDTCTLYYSSSVDIDGYVIKSTNSSNCLTFTTGETTLYKSSTGWDNYYLTGSLISMNKEDDKEYMFYQGRSYDNSGAGYIGVGYASRGLICDNRTPIKGYNIKIKISANNNSIDQIYFNNSSHFSSIGNKVINWKSLLWGINQ